MSNLYEMFETNPVLEEDGVWVKITEGLEIKISALGNKKHLAVLEKLKKPYKAQYRRDLMDPEKDEEIHCRAMAEAVILDWRGEGWKDKEGKSLPYSPDNAFKILSDPAMKGFKADILFLATAKETFKQEEQDKEDAIKN